MESGDKTVVIRNLVTFLDIAGETFETLTSPEEGEIVAWLLRSMGPAGGWDSDEREWVGDIPDVIETTLFSLYDHCYFTCDAEPIDLGVLLDVLATSGATVDGYDASVEFLATVVESLGEWEEREQQEVKRNIENREILRLRTLLTEVHPKHPQAEICAACLELGR